MSKKKPVTKKRRVVKKKKFLLFNSRGNIAFTAILGVVIVGSVLLVSGIFPIGQITPRDPNAPKFRVDPDQKKQSNSNLHLKTINFQRCSSVTAVDMLLDTTGSMGPTTYVDPQTGETKMDKLKNSTKLFLSNFSDDSVIGIQRFSSREIREVVPISLFKDVKSDILPKIDALPNTGGTPTTEGLRFSLDTLRSGMPRFPNYKFTFIFVSDGEPDPASHDPRLPNNAPDPSTEIKNLGVTVYSIGILSPAQIQSGKMKQLLEHIASSPDKAFIAPDGNQLTEIYKKIGTEMCQKAGGSS